MSSKKGNLFSIDRIKDNLDLNILTQFHYPDNILAEMRKDLENIAETILKPNRLEISEFNKISKKYVDDIEKTPFYDANKSLISIKYLRKIKKYNDRKIKSLFVEKDLNYSFPLESDLYFHTSYLNQTTYTIQLGYQTTTPIESKTHINIFREFFNDKTLSKSIIIKILNKINEIIKKVFPMMVNFFLEDMSHYKYLTERIDFQDKMETLVYSVQQIGSIDTTRSIKRNLKELFETFFGISSSNIEYCIGGRTYFETIKTKTFLQGNYAYFTHINIHKKSPDFEFDTLLKLIINLEKVLKTNNISYQKKGRIFSDISKDKTIIDNILDQSLKNFFRDNTAKGKIQSQFGGIKTYSDYSTTLHNYLSVFRNTYYMGNKNIRTKIPLQRKINFSKKDIFGVEREKNQYTITVRTFDEIIESLFEKLTFKMKTQNDSLVNTFHTIIPFYTHSIVSLKIFDLIDYFIIFAEEVKKFFQQSMDLKAIIQKKKFTERWDGSKGWMDVNATIEKSLAKGFITPMQTYRKMMQEDPPTIYLVFDTSSSMSNETRMAQFISIIILSFFERDVNKFITGWITNTGEQAWQTYHGKKNARKYFKSKVRTPDLRKAQESEDRKKKNYSVEKAKVNKYYQFIQHKIISNVGNIMTDYHPLEYYDGLRDFLDNDIAGDTGTAIDVFNFLPSHYDLSNRGLKYVFVVTDAEFHSNAEKFDFVTVSQELIDRPDVRYFFIWDAHRFWGDDSDSKYGTRQRSFQFPTRQFIRRQIDSFIFDKDGNFNPNFPKADVSLLSFVYQHYEKVHLVRPENIMKVGEIKYILNKLEEQKFFIP